MPPYSATRGPGVTALGRNSTRPIAHPAELMGQWRMTRQRVSSFSSEATEAIWAPHSTTHGPGPEPHGPSSRPQPVRPPVPAPPLRTTRPRASYFSSGAPVRLVKTSMTRGPGRDRRGSRSIPHPSLRHEITPPLPTTLHLRRCCSSVDKWFNRTPPWATRGRGAALPGSNNTPQRTLQPGAWLR